MELTTWLVPNPLGQGRWLVVVEVWRRWAVPVGSDPARTAFGSWTSADELEEAAGVSRRLCCKLISKLVQQKKSERKIGISTVARKTAVVHVVCHIRWLASWPPGNSRLESAIIHKIRLKIINHRIWEINYTERIKIII